MKVFCCKNQYSYGGGLILVAANTKEEAYLTAAYNDKTSYLFDWADDDCIWCEPDGNINHCTSDTYPLEEWHEVEHLSTDLLEPQIPMSLMKMNMSQQKNVFQQRLTTGNI